MQYPITGFSLHCTTALYGSPACKLAPAGSVSLIRVSVPYTVTLNNTHWKTIKAIERQSAHPFVLIIHPQACQH